MSVFGSTLLHDKLFLTQQDWRSWHSEPSTPENNFAWGRAETAEAYNAMVRRESGMMLAYGMGTYFCDMAGGWLRDDEIMKGIAEARSAFEQDLTVPGIPRADMAVFVSEESDSCLYPQAAIMLRDLHGSLQGHDTSQCQQFDLNTSGVPYRYYLLSDLGRIKLPEHRVYLFLNAYRLDAAQMKAIDGLRRDGKLLVFLHAPGIAGAGLDLNLRGAEAIERVTGIKVGAIPGGVGQFGAVPVGARNPLLVGIHDYLAANIRGSSAIPAFEVVDEKATPLATYPGKYSVSVAYKQFAHHQTVLAGCFDLKAQFIHNLAKAAGAWYVAEPGDAVYANENFVTIHALGDGNKTLYLARPSKVVDLTTGKVVAEQTKTIHLDMTVGETRWFRLIP